MISKSGRVKNSSLRENKKLFYGFLRLAITGQMEGPNIVDIIKVIGVEEAFNRVNAYYAALDKAICVLKTPEKDVR